MNTNPSGIVQFQVVMSGALKRAVLGRAMFGLADDGRVYQWNNTRKVWMVITENKFDLREPVKE